MRRRSWLPTMAAKSSYRVPIFLRDVFAVVTSPSGAVLMLFHEADEATSEHHPGGIGGVHWTELHSTDLDADMPWLKACFAFEVSEMPMPDGTYYVLNHKGETCGGAMVSAIHDAPSLWLSWIEVEDVDATAERAKQHGGQVFGDIFEMPDVGRMVVIADPTGAAIGIITPPKKAS